MPCGSGKFFFHFPSGFDASTLASKRGEKKKIIIILTMWVREAGIVRYITIPKTDGKAAVKMSKQIPERSSFGLLT